MKKAYFPRFFVDILSVPLLLLSRRNFVQPFQHSETVVIVCKLRYCPYVTACLAFRNAQKFFYVGADIVYPESIGIKH